MPKIGILFFNAYFISLNSTLSLILRFYLLNRGRKLPPGKITNLILFLEKFSL